MERRTSRHETRPFAPNSVVSLSDGFCQLTAAPLFPVTTMCKAGTARNSPGPRRGRDPPRIKCLFTMRAGCRAVTSGLGSD